MESRAAFILTKVKLAVGDFAILRTGSAAPSRGRARQQLRCAKQAARWRSECSSECSASAAPRSSRRGECVERAVCLFPSRCVREAVRKHDAREPVSINDARSARKNRRNGYARGLRDPSIETPRSRVRDNDKRAARDNKRLRRARYECRPRGSRIHRHVGVWRWRVLLILEVSSGGTMRPMLLPRRSQKGRKKKEKKISNAKFLPRGSEIAFLEFALLPRRVPSRGSKIPVELTCWASDDSHFFFSKTRFDVLRRSARLSPLYLFPIFAPPRTISRYASDPKARIRRDRELSILTYKSARLLRYIDIFRARGESGNFVPAIFRDIRRTRWFRARVAKILERFFIHAGEGIAVKIVKCMKFGKESLVQILSI